VAGSYPTRRPRPQRLAEAALAPSYCEEVPVEPQPLAETRTSIAEQVERHATDGEGLLVLAHPPGTGKGHNTIQGLRQWLGAVPSGDDGSGFLVWTALRKAQLNDQEGIPLIPLDQIPIRSLLPTGGSEGEGCGGHRQLPSRGRGQRRGEGGYAP
jgi:hypothetical protein